MISATNEPRKMGEVVANPEIVDDFGNKHYQPLRIVRVSNYEEWCADLLSRNPEADTELTEDFRWFYEISVD